MSGPHPQVSATHLGLCFSRFAKTKVKHVVMITLDHYLRGTAIVIAEITDITPAVYEITDATARACNVATRGSIFVGHPSGAIDQDTKCICMLTSYTYGLLWFMMARRPLGVVQNVGLSQQPKRTASTKCSCPQDVSGDLENVNRSGLTLRDKE